MALASRVWLWLGSSPKGNIQRNSETRSFAAKALASKVVGIAASLGMLIRFVGVLGSAVTGAGVVVVAEGSGTGLRI